MLVAAENGCRVMKTFEYTIAGVMVDIFGDKGEELPWVRDGVGSTRKVGMEVERLCAEAALKPDGAEDCNNCQN